jgi:hypothetical protein
MNHDDDDEFCAPVDAVPALEMGISALATERLRTMKGQ